MNPLLAELLECLDLETLPSSPNGFDRFQARCETSRHGRIFGGQVLGQALMAAGKTTAGRPCHSLQALFLKLGDPTRPIEFEVERLRDGRSFSARRVLARQGEQAIFSLQASFHDEEPGYEHQIPGPKAPDPESVPSAAETVERMREHFPPATADWASKPRAIEIRHSVLPSYLGGKPSLEPDLAWFRAEAELPDDPLLHQCLLAYSSDIGLNDNAYRPHCGPDAPGLQSMSSVDHSMWFHVPARIDEWVLYYQESPKGAGARGYARGAMYTRDGTLIASMGQDSVMRPLPV
jgi:acyl-CoA thioesterase-2